VALESDFMNQLRPQFTGRTLKRRITSLGNLFLWLISAIKSKKSLNH
jgi:hypothetical protein